MVMDEWNNSLQRHSYAAQARDQDKDYGRIQIAIARPA